MWAFHWFWFQHCQASSSCALCSAAGHARLLPPYIPEGVWEVQALHPLQHITVGCLLLWRCFISKHALGHCFHSLVAGCFHGKTWNTNSNLAMMSQIAKFQDARVSLQKAKRNSLDQKNKNTKLFVLHAPFHICLCHPEFSKCSCRGKQSRKLLLANLQRHWLLEVRGIWLAKMM